MTNNQNNGSNNAATAVKSDANTDFEERQDKIINFLLKLFKNILMHINEYKTMSQLRSVCVIIVWT